MEKYETNHTRPINLKHTVEASQQSAGEDSVNQQSTEFVSRFQQLKADASTDRMKNSPSTSILKINTDLRKQHRTVLKHHGSPKQEQRRQAQPEATGNSNGKIIQINMETDSTINQSPSDLLENSNEQPQPFKNGRISQSIENENRQHQLFQNQLQDEVYEFDGNNFDTNLAVQRRFPKI